jgi:hypothetical protein
MSDVITRQPFRLNDFLIKVIKRDLVTKTSLLNLEAKRGTRVLNRVNDDNLELEDSQMPRKMDEKY